MIKRLDLILNGKGGVGKSYNRLLYFPNQSLKTAVGRLVLCKPFLATAAVWLDSAARCCGLRLRFCVRKTCPALGARQPSVTLRQDFSSDKFRIELDQKVLDNRGVAGELLLRRVEKIKTRFGEDIRTRRFAGFDLFIRSGFNNTAELVLCGKNSYSIRVTDIALGTIRSLESVVQGFEESVRRLESDIKDLQKRATELEVKVGAPFEKEERYHKLVNCQSEIEEQLDLTKNQAPSQIETPDNGENDVEIGLPKIVEKPEKQARRVRVKV
jgi:hypothetical protein